MKRLTFCIIFIVVTGCKSTSDIQSITDIKRLAKEVTENPHDITAIHKQVIKTEKSITADIQSVDKLLETLRHIINKEWGQENGQFPERKKYVKYSNNYQARAIVDFEKGYVVVETIAKKDISNLLSQAITMTLLTSSDPRKTDIFSSKAPELGDEPFLYQQVHDRDNKAIRYSWRANRFAEYLVSHQLEKRNKHGKTIHAVTFPLVDDNLHLRKEKFSEYVIASSRRYQIPASLIYGVIETESSFNPYAVSHANAYGLMQVVASTAGKDVYQRVKKISGQPSKATLFDPQKNIDIGTAYLYLLQQTYLGGVENNTSQHYAMISAYNGGTGNVLKSFHTNRKTAIKVINEHKPSNVYYVLTRKHPRAESRRYLEKVTKAEKGYQ
jgi:peptidoglycan lytic transglycosylase C